MDDIQVWVYILFGIIYFLVRAFKKKEPQKPPRPHASQGRPGPERKPVTFEELLREFTEGREAQNEPQEEVVSYQPPEKEEKKPALFEEGRTRQFADEESRRVYEESIARAEGALQTTSENDFRSKLKRKEEEKNDGNLAAEVKGMLSNPEDARKAVILSEILTRKY